MQWLLTHYALEYLIICVFSALLKLRSWDSGPRDDRAGCSRPSDWQRQTTTVLRWCRGNQLTSTGKAEPLMTGSIPCRTTAVNEVLGAVPCRYRWTLTPSLNKTRWETPNQCEFAMIGFPGTTSDTNGAQHRLAAVVEVKNQTYGNCTIKFGLCPCCGPLA